MKKKLKRPISLIMAFLIMFTAFPLSGMNIKASAMNSKVETAINWACDTANDPKHGYSQDGRYGPDDFDCSSLVCFAFRIGGFNISDITTTYHMKEVFMNAGFSWIPLSQLGDLEKGDTSKLRRGDILLYIGNIKIGTGHTEIYLGGNRNVGALRGTTDGRGRYSCGEKKGDQGNEIRELNYRWCNWDGVLRYEYEDHSLETPCNKYFEANENTVIVRDGPANTYNQIGEFHIGEEVHAIALFINNHKNIWYKVEYKGKTGWIYSVRLRELSTYKITYNANGGKGAPSAQNKKKNAGITISSVMPTRDKYQFVGWSNVKVNDHYNDLKSAQAQVRYNPGDKYSTNKNLSLYAVWLETKTTVALSSYNVNLCIDDNKTATVDVTIKGVVNSGYKVEMSSVDKATASVSKINVSSLSKLKTLAHIENNLGTAKITLNAESKGTSIMYVYVKDTTGKVVAKSGITINVTKKYYITYNANGGTGAPAKQTKISDQNQYISSNVPTREGYCFMGWATPGSNGAAVYGPGDIYNIDSNITLTAVWGVDYCILPSLSDDKTVLTIFGHGDMPCYGLNTYNTSPWRIKEFSEAYKTVTTIKFVALDGGQITSIGSYAFAGFNKLTNIEIPITVSRIHSYAFYGCGSLRTVSVPERAVLGSYAFANCSNLSNYKKTSTKKSASSKVTAMSVEDNSGLIGAFAFENCKNLQSIDIENISFVGESAFSGCTSLTDVKLSNDLNIIEDSAFYNCKALTDIEIPDSVKEISDGAFSGCTSLDEINLPENIEIIGEQAFSGCTSIESVELPETIDSIGSSAFANCTSLATVDLPDNTICLSDSMFSGCTSLQSISMPSSVMNIGDGTFLGCTGLKSIKIPESIGEIGDNTFAYCKSLTSIDIPDSVSVIKDFAFFGCTGLKDIDFSVNLDSIGTCAFADCISLQSISLPGSLSTINEAAFADCTSLKNVDFEESMLSISDEAFAGCTSLGSIKIPECASYVSSAAFSNCSKTLSISCYSTSDVYDQLTNSGISYNTIYPVEGLKLTGSKTTLKKGETLQLSPVFTPANATNKALKWFCENEDVASVSDAGIVTAKGSGSAIIVATTVEGNYEAIYEVNCTIPVESITVNDNFEKCFVGEASYVSYDLNPDNPTDFDLRYKSSNNNVATVNEDGLISFVGIGKAIIEVASADGNAKTSFTVNVNEFIPTTGIKLNLSNLELKVNETAKLSATVMPSNATFKDFYFYSEDESIATVDGNGNVKAIKEGSTKIVCIGNDEVEVECIVSVKAGAQTVESVSVSDVSINFKSSAKITPVIKADEGAKYTVEYSSSDSSVVTVDKNGNVYGSGRGRAKITCTVTDTNGKIITDTCEVNVTYSAWQWFIVIVLFGWIWYK